MAHPPAEPEHAPAVPIGAAAYTLEQVQSTCLLVLTVLASGAVLWWLRPVVVPFLAALALFYLLAPIRGWLVRRISVPAWVGVLGAAAIGLGVVTLAGVLVWGCVAEVTRDAEMYSEQATRLMADPVFASAAEWAGFERDPESGRPVLVTQNQIRRFVRAAVGWLHGLVTDTVLVLVFLLFMLMGGSGTKGRDGGLPGEAAIRVRQYMFEMFAFSIITGMVVSGILAWLGVKFALSFGFLAFVLNFIPTIGSLIAALLPIPVVLLDSGLPVWAKVLALALPPTINGVLANVIQPQFQSRTQGVHPVVTMLALIVFGMLWGPVGAVLAVPLAAILKIAFERIPGGRPFADLLAGKLEGVEQIVDGREAGAERFVQAGTPSEPQTPG